MPVPDRSEVGEILTCLDRYPLSMTGKLGSGRDRRWSLREDHPLSKRLVDGLAPRAERPVIRGRDSRLRRRLERPDADGLPVLLDLDLEAPERRRPLARMRRRRDARAGRKVHDPLAVVRRLRVEAEVDPSR